MTSKESLVVRFAVGQPDGPQSSVWRLSVKGNDVYIALREIAKVKKITLHESGSWRNAWTTEQIAKGLPFLAPGEDRATDKWRPLEWAPGLIRAFDIVVPASEVTCPKHLDPNGFSGKKIEWVPSAPEGYATYTSRLCSLQRR